MKSTAYLKLLGFLLVYSNSAFAQHLASPEPVFSYIVKKNESFSTIARQYLARYADIPKLAAFNQWAVNKKLQPNQEIKIPKSLLKVKPTATELVALIGDLQVQDNKDKSKKPAILGQQLNVGDVLVSANNSKATLRFADGTTTELQPNSTLKLMLVGQYAGLNTYVNDIQLNAGRVEISANPQQQQGYSMRVITPSAVAAVRGTKFRVGAEGLLGFEETLEGSVALNAAGEQILVNHGFGSLAEKDQQPLPPVVLLAAPDVSQLNQTIKTLPATFNMPKQDNVAAWSAQITRLDGTVAQQVLSKDKALVALADMPDGVYSMRVRGQDALGLQGYDSSHQFELNARPFAPILEAPLSPFRSLPKFTWKTVDGVEQYLIEVSQSDKFNEKIVNAQLKTNEFSFSQLTAGQYYVRVASVEQAETGAYSQTQAFIYQPLEFVPEFDRNEFFADKAQVKLNLPPLPQTLHYDITLSKDAERQQVVWQRKVSQTNADFAKPAQGKYYYSVRYIDDTGIKGPITTYPIQVR